jgi:hypothetical protein
MYKKVENHHQVGQKSLGLDRWMRRAIVGGVEHAIGWLVNKWKKKGKEKDAQQYEQQLWYFKLLTEHVMM